MLYQRDKSSRRYARYLTTSTLAVLALGATYGVASGLDWEEICPTSLEGKLSSDSFEFQFQSWSSSGQQGSYFICHCVRNDTMRPLWIEWEKTGISSMTRREVPNYVRQSYSSNDFVKTPAKLWYGLQPRNLDTQIVVPRNAQLASLLTTDGLVTVPNDYALAKVYPTSIEAMRGAEILSSSKALQTIEAAFESRIDAVGTLTQTLRIAAELDTSLFKSNKERYASFIWVGIDDETLHRQLFSQSRPIPLRAFVAPVGYDPLPAIFHDDNTRADISVTVPAREKEPARKQAHLLFYGPDAKLVIASLPIAYAN